MRATAGQGRERSIHERGAVPGCARQEDDFVGGGCIGEPVAGKAGLGGSDAICDGVWAGEVLHVHPCRSGCDEWSGEGGSGGTSENRDVFNERPTREEQTIASATAIGNGRSRSTAASSTTTKHSAATLHTTLGDIHLTLYTELVPKTCKNFVGLAKKGYYDNVIFHRIIKKFMLQTGDPLGDGTGGESRWGGNFEDEFHPSLNHSKPFTLSMANAGPNTNGSQFFITTVPTPWLDRKHTVFGKVEAGMDVVKRIEEVKVDKNDKPRQDVRIINVSLR